MRDILVENLKAIALRLRSLFAETKAARIYGFYQNHRMGTVTFNAYQLPTGLHLWIVGEWGCALAVKATGEGDQVYLADFTSANCNDPHFINAVGTIAEMPDHQFAREKVE